MTVPTFSNLPPIQSLPGHLQPEFNHNLPSTTLNVPMVNQFASNGAQMSSFINPDFAGVGQGTFGQNFSLDKGIPVVSQSAIPQQNIELDLQSGHGIGDLVMKTQKQLQPPNYGSSITSNAALVSDFNQSRNYLPQTITSDINKVVSEESVNRQLPPDSVVIETIREQVTRPMILNAFCPVPQQTSAEGQVERPAEELMPERIPTIPLANMNSDVNPNAPRMMLTLVDSEKGIAQQIELLTTAADNPLILPMNTNLPTLSIPAGDQILSPVEQQRQVQAIMMNAVPPGDQILSPVEQQRQVQEIMMNTDRLIDVSVPNNATLVNVPVQSDEGSAQLKMNSQCIVDRNSECDPSLSRKEATITQETESNQSILTMILSTVPESEITQNPSVALQAPFHLEKVDLLFHPDQNPTASNEMLATIMVSGQDIPSVVDKSTNTAEHTNNEGISNQNIDFNKSDQTKTSVPYFAANYGKLRESKNLNKSNYDKETNISGLRNTYSSSNTDIETQLSKSSQDILHRSESQNIGKHGRKPHKSSNVSREQGFQKLHSKNGKVFLQSTTQRSEESRKMCSDPGAGDIAVGRVPDISNTEVNTSDRRLASAKTIIPDEKDETYISSENASRQGTDKEVSSGHVKTTPVSKPKDKKTRNKIHITDGVKDKIRQSLNIPILPKPTSSEQSMGRIPVGLQPLQSSLFVIPPTPPRSQTSENITSLLHMSKSKVKIQPPLDQNI